MAQWTGRERLCRTRQRILPPARRAGDGPGRRGFAGVRRGWRRGAGQHVHGQGQDRCRHCGDGALSWGDHHPCLFSGTERFFRPGYRANLVSSWLPALDNVVPQLEQGARVADIGCGHGASTIVMSKAYPKSSFYGYDFHAPSIEKARQRAQAAGLGERAQFAQATAQDFPGSEYDLVCFFDCLHDMGDPVGAAKRAHSALKPGGAVLLVEPFANDELDDNLNPVGRLFYAASTCICTPNSLSQPGKLGLGAQAGERRLRHVFEEAGFRQFRRATETPFNLVFEARK